MAGVAKKTGLEDQLRQAIANSGLSQRRLATLAGVHQPQLSWFMQGERSLTLWAAGRIAAVVGFELAPAQNDAGLEVQLRQAIADSPLNRNQLGFLSGVDPGQLSRFARGQRTLTLRSAERVAHVLELKLRPKSRHITRP